MIRIYNAKLLTPAANAVTEGELWIGDDGRVSLVGKPQAPLPVFSREINARQNLVLPGFKNAHTHSAMTFLRSRADDLPLWDWLSKQVFPRENCLTDEDVYWLTKLAILEYVSGGTTACFDMYMHEDAFVRACIESGFRAVLCGAAMASDENGIEKLASFYETYNGKHDLISARLGFHAEYTANEEMLREIAALAQEKRAPVYMHNSETKAEVDGCLERHGKTPTELFCSLGIHEFGGGGFHCVWMSERDIALFREKKLCAVTCPASNLKLASGIAPLSKFVEQGVPFAIGTDGPASNNCLDMFRELFLCTALQKLQNNDAAALPANLVLSAAVRDGAHAMGLFDCDGLAPGNFADLTILNLQSPNMQPEMNLIKNIVYSGSKQNVLLTMVAGKVLYENGEFHIGENLEIIYQKAAEIAARIEEEL